MNIVCTKNIDYIRILINGCLHFIIKQDDFESLQSFSYDSVKYVIEVYTKSNNTIILEYNSKRKWIEVLKCFNAMFE